MFRWLIRVRRLERRERGREGPSLLTVLFVRSIDTAMLLKVQWLVEH